MGKLAGVISYDENVKNQFKYTNTIGYTNRTGPRPLVPGAAPSARLAPPVPPLILIKEIIDKLENIYRAGNVPQFDIKIGDCLTALITILKNDGILTFQTAETDAIISSINSLAGASSALSVLPVGSVFPATILAPIFKTLEMLYGYISTLYSNKSAAQPTGASGVGETKRAGKFMNSYHAKRFLKKISLIYIYK